MSTGAADDQPSPARSTLVLSSLGLLCALAVAAMTALGMWQLERRVWKLKLIEEIAQRVQAAPIEAPGPSQWPRVSADADAYRRVRLAGQYLNDRETLVHAATRLGAGYWVLTPLRTVGGFTVLVNRGFVPTERREAATRTAGLISAGTVVGGLLRVTEPNGAFLHANDPAADRWYSRDVAAIAAVRLVAPIAPYFIDADATPVAGGLPVGGLTVIELPNNHLVYAITWFALALMLAGAAAYVGREEWRIRRRAAGHVPGKRGPSAST